MYTCMTDVLFCCTMYIIAYNNYDMSNKKTGFRAFQTKPNQTKPIDICHKKDKRDEKDDSLGDNDDDESL